MRTAFETVAVAFSMFSALPMPRVAWKDSNMRYALCAFPLVGLAIGLAQILWAAVCGLGLPPVLRGMGLCLLPVWLTGGIHLDGYADTCDARASFASPARRQEILRDPHLGAFAAIRLGAYFVADFALWTALPEAPWGLLLLAPCASRALSGLAITSFPLAAESSLAKTFADAAARSRAKAVLAALSALLLLGLCAQGPGDGPRGARLLFPLPPHRKAGVRRPFGGSCRLVPADGRNLDAGRALRGAVGRKDSMLLITGPLFAGKRECAAKLLGVPMERLADLAVWDVQDLAATAPDLTALADALAARPVVIATEVGGGVVPVDPAQRAAREAAGRLSCLLAARAETVVRVCCGIPQLLKGEWPC